MCLHIKRNDAASRRFCQYLTLQSRQVVTLIRDVKTGQILYKPPEGPDGQYWLSRTKSGLGRASKNEYDVTSVRILISSSKPLDYSHFIIVRNLLLHCVLKTLWYPHIYYEVYRLHVCHIS